MKTTIVIQAEPLGCSYYIKQAQLVWKYKIEKSREQMRVKKVTMKVHVIFCIVWILSCVLENKTRNRLS